MLFDRVFDPVPERYREVYPERMRPVVVVKGAQPPKPAEETGRVAEVRQESGGGWARILAGWSRFAGEKV